MSLTDEQLAERVAYLGGSDAPALAGLNPPGWSQPIDVWLEKRPDLAGDAAPPKRTHALMGMGTLLEPVVAQLFTAATGIELRRALKPVRSRRYPWMGGHLDRRTYGAIFEAKWQQHEKGFGPSQWAGPEVGWLPGEPVIPPHYMLQVQHYLIVTERPVAFVGLLLGYAEFRAYRVQADHDLQAMLVELEQRFWHEHVLTGIPPEPDGSESYGRLIAARLREDRGTELVATPEQGAWMRTLQVARDHRKEAEQTERLAKQNLQLSMGEAASLIGAGFSATYRSHEVREVDWKATAESLAFTLVDVRNGTEAVPRLADVDAVLQERAARFTKTRTQRPFRPKWDDDEEAPGGE